MILIGQGMRWFGTADLPGHVRLAPNGVDATFFSPARVPRNSSDLPRYPHLPIHDRSIDLFLFVSTITAK